MRSVWCHYVAFDVCKTGILKIVCIDFSNDSLVFRDNQFTDIHLSAKIKWEGVTFISNTESNCSKHIKYCVINLKRPFNISRFFSYFDPTIYNAQLPFLFDQIHWLSHSYVIMIVIPSKRMLSLMRLVSKH